MQTRSELTLNAYLNCHYEKVITASEVKKHTYELSNYMDKLVMTEKHDKQATKDKPDTYYTELGPHELPRARSTAPAQSLPATTRPA